MNESLILEWYEWIVFEYYDLFFIMWQNKMLLKNIYNNNLQCDETMHLIDIFSSLSRDHKYYSYPYITGMSKSEYGCT